MDYHGLAATLDHAAKNAQSIDQLSHTQPFNVEDAYVIQSLSMARRYRRGEKWCGLKLGFTSFAKMEQMGIRDMIWGRLTDKMHFGSSQKLVRSNFIHPRAEPEIAFRLKQDVVEALTLENCKSFVDGIAVAIEIIDSRFQNFKFSLEDVIADNCSSSGFAVGEWHGVESNIENEEIQLILDNEVVEKGNTNAILGNPWLAFCAATRLAMQYHEFLPSGTIILAGAATPAIYIDGKEQVKATVVGLGMAQINITN